MKKCAMMIAAAVAAACLAEEAASVEVCSPCGDAEKELESLVVGGVYGEGSNSSFIVRTELTATRFIRIGRHFLALTAYAKELEGRVAALEARFKKMDDEAEERRKAREALAEERKRKDAVRRATERGRRARK